MPERGDHELLDDWRRLMDALLAPAGAIHGPELPRDLLKATRRQLELVQELVERQRKLQGDLAGRLTAPIDAIFDLFTETADTLGRQAEALEAAGSALEETAGLMRRQAERFERTVVALRQPADLAKTVAGAKPRPKKRTKR